MFVPGAGHLGRIAYGHPEGDPRDFVAHWVAQSGLPFLAVSYPLDNPVYETLHPEFDVARLGPVDRSGRRAGGGRART